MRKNVLLALLIVAGLIGYEASRLQSLPNVLADTSYRYLHITDTSIHSVTNGYSILHTVTINNAGASAVITIYDLPAPVSGATNTCTSTPTTNKVAIITLPASGALPGSLLYDVAFQNGICVLDATAASDLTISFNP